MKTIKFKIKQEFLDDIESGVKRFETRSFDSVVEKIQDFPEIGTEYRLELVSLETGKSTFYNSTLAMRIDAENIEGLNPLDEGTKAF